MKFIRGVFFSYFRSNYYIECWLKYVLKSHNSHVVRFKFTILYVVVGIYLLTFLNMADNNEQNNFVVISQPRDKYNSLPQQTPNKNVICLTISENGMPKCPTKNHVPLLFDTSTLNVL